MDTGYAREEKVHFPEYWSKYFVLLKEEKEKPDCDSKLIEEYQTHQLGAKLFAEDIMPQALMIAMGPVMMVVPGIGMMIGAVIMNEPESYGNSFP